jgi:hypothetical protein
MKRMVLLLCVITGLGGLGAAGCDKPSADDCQRALENMQQLMSSGPANAFDHPDISGEVRRCRTGSTRESVACAIAAKSADDLKACKFESAKPKE